MSYHRSYRHRRAMMIRDDRTIAAERARKRALRAKKRALRAKRIAAARTPEAVAERQIQRQRHKKILKWAGIGLVAATVIGNAIPQHPTPHRTPVRAVVTTPAAKRAAHHHKPPLCWSKADLANDTYGHACTQPPKPKPKVCKDNDVNTNWATCKLTKAQIDRAKVDDTPSTCADKASALALVEALSGNAGGTVGAGKIALDTAGTGEKC